MICEEVVRRQHDGLVLRGEQGEESNCPVHLSKRNLFIEYRNPLSAPLFKRQKLKQTKNKIKKDYGEFSVVEQIIDLLVSLVSLSKIS